MINRDPIHLKNVGKMRGRVALRTQNNTMSALSHPVMTALLVNAAKQMEGIVAYRLYESHGDRGMP